MEHIHDTLKKMITKDMISNAASTLGEKESNIESGLSIILPSLLAKLLKTGATPQINETAELAGEHKLINNVKELFEGHGVINGMNLGERFENAIFGVESEAYMKAVASKSGMKAENVDRLNNWVAGMTAAYFGDRIKKEKTNMKALLAELDSEKKSLFNHIPDNVYTVLGLSSVYTKPVEHVAPKPTPAPAAKAAPTPSAKVSEKPKKNSYSWIWWLLLIALIIILIFWWRGCSRDKDASNTKVERVETVNTNTANNANNAANNTSMTNRESMQITLNDGRKITVYKGGAEHMINDFLSSDRYKKASNDSLKKIWFSFDNIDFVHNSSTELMAGSESQLNNLIELMKNHKDVKFVVGGFADKTGSDNVNKEISKERAEHIKQRFVKAGIPANRIKTEWFSDTFATHSAKASDSERAEDRQLGMRFEK